MVVIEEMVVQKGNVLTRVTIKDGDGRSRDLFFVLIRKRKII